MITAVAGRDAPFLIQAQFLHDMDVPALASTHLGMVAMPVKDEMSSVAPGTGPDNSAAPRRIWRERDLRRALDAARRAGLSDYRVEIAPDGAIAIVIGSACRTSARRRG